MQSHSTSVLPAAAGIDWLTATARPGRQADSLAQFAGQLVDDEERAGNRLRPWRFQGYRGFQAGSAFFGTRPDGVIVRMGGAMAARWAPAAAGLAQTVTRCDLQVTWMDPLGDASAAVRTLWHTRAERAKIGRPPEREFTEREIGAPYIYFGRRESEWFGRIYNKHADKPADFPPGSIRAEVEAKGRAAEALAARLAHGNLDTAFVTAYTHDWYRTRGINLPFPPGGGADLDLAPREPTDATRTVRWLGQSVAPSVARAVAWVGLDATLAALGLDDAVRREYSL